MSHLSACIWPCDTSYLYVPRGLLHYLIVSYCHCCTSACRREGHAPSLFLLLLTTHAGLAELPPPSPGLQAQTQPQRSPYLQ